MKDLCKIGWHVTFRGVWGRFSHPIELTRPTKGLYGVLGRAAAAFRAQCQGRRMVGCRGALGSILERKPVLCLYEARNTGVFLCWRSQRRNSRLHLGDGRKRSWSR